MSPYETLYSFQDIGFVIWTEGPRIGEIYRIVKHQESFNDFPSIEETESTVKVLLEQAANLSRHFDELNQGEDPENKRYLVAAEKRRKIAEIINLLY